MFQLYAVRRFCSEQKPFIWYKYERYFLFVEDGVYELPNHFRSDTLNFRIRTLVDSDETATIPNQLTVHESRNFTIFTTSPNNHRWSPLLKTALTTVFHMNPWTRWEIHQAYVPSLS
jgi:hypothetical protein